MYLSDEEVFLMSLKLKNSYLRFSTRIVLNLLIYLQKLRPYNNLWQGDSRKNCQVLRMKKQVTWFFNVHFDCRLQNRFLDNCKLYMVNHLIGDYYIALLFANKLVGWGQFLQKTFKNKQHSRYIFWLLSITSFNLKRKLLLK